MSLTLHLLHDIRSNTSEQQWCCMLVLFFASWFRVVQQLRGSISQLKQTRKNDIAKPHGLFDVLRVLALFDIIVVWRVVVGLTNALRQVG